jgi:hypothetical protein
LNSRGFSPNYGEKRTCRIKVLRPNPRLPNVKARRRPFAVRRRARDEAAIVIEEGGLWD